MKSPTQLLWIIFFTLTTSSFGQISITPASGGQDDQVTITFDASLGNKELKGASSIYMHHGAVTDNLGGTAWKYVKGNWGKDDGIGKMTKVAGSTDKWQITLTPSVKAYFGTGSETIYRIAGVFRSADGNVKGTIAPGQFSWGTVAANGDNYINLKVDNYILLTQPVASSTVINQGDKVNIAGEASSSVTDMKLWIDDGTGYVVKSQVSAGTLISFEYIPTSSKSIKIKLTALLNGQNLEVLKDYNITIKKPSTIAALPPGVKQGVNYSSDPTTATLVLLAPKKQLVHVVGDFNNWSIDDQYQMNQTPDDEYFWVTLNNLTPSKSYVYQYWIDGKIKVADPYTHQVADPWNDKFIESSVFPNLPPYNKESNGIASVLKTGQAVYAWASSESTWKRPDVNHLTIYELHLRDFFAAHSFDALRDTLQYIKRLGVNAIELMPISEFEGNDSWGYNPSFYFAVDKYYGTKEALKRLIEVAHAEGLAVILDIVLNHSFGQSPLLQMYFDENANKPALDNPWYNRDGVGQYQWGYDFNHESPYVKKFVDDVNAFWLQQFHFDGFRFDFTKGFTNSAPGGSVDNFDQSRINILKRMSNAIKTIDPKAYIILEHWAPANEEQILANDGMKMWRNKSYDYVPAAVGKTSGTFSSTNATSHVSLYNSHDEQRIAKHCLDEGLSFDGYNVRNKSIMLERVKMTAAFFFLQPGPKMMWQFDELGYDIDINFNGRIGRKPLVWGAGSLNYYNDPERQNVYAAYQGILDVREKIGAAKMASAISKHKHEGNVRRLSYDTDGVDLVVIGNVDVKDASIDPQFTKVGTWYDYFNGDSIIVTNVASGRPLKAGEWHIYTSKRLSSGKPGVVAVYENPVSVVPSTFLATQEITLRFDAKKANPNGTAGLIGASKIYMHAGVKFVTASTGLELVKTYPDHGAMTPIGNDIWEIKLTPNTYFGATAEQDIRQLGMWFRDESGTKLGYGFRGDIIYIDVKSPKPIITVDPPGFTGDTEVTITFDAGEGNRELAGASKIYMHSGVGTVNTANPATSAWSKVKGNWGQDDGVGLMTNIGGDKWQLKLKPKDYYGLTVSEKPFWIAAVFRNASGGLKGTTSPGNYPFGIVADNQDYFIKNNIVIATDDDILPKLLIYPNPSQNVLILAGWEGKATLDIMDITGKPIQQIDVLPNDPVDVSALQSGTYHCVVRKNSQVLGNASFIKID